MNTIWRSFDIFTGDFIFKKITATELFFTGINYNHMPIW